ncbi:hypothetical protein [Fibrobacter sp.]|uniref:hypothetical protein n=1 Tax=Fibrobacter sp. TaxID=35828 RepID=UPI00386A1A4F
MSSNPFAEYYAQCQRSEYADAFNKAETIWRKQLWNPTPTRNKILALVKEHFDDLSDGNPFVHEFEQSLMLDRLRKFSYSTEKIRFDETTSKMLADAMKPYASYLENKYTGLRYMINETTSGFSFRHPFKTFGKIIEPTKPDYYVLQMHIIDAHVEMKERIWNVPESMYKDEYEGIANCDFTIYIFSDNHPDYIASIEFPYQHHYIHGKRYSDKDDLAFVLTETNGKHDYPNQKMLLYADATCTPFHVWIASLGDGVLKMEDEILQKLEEYINKDHVQHTERGNEINAWSEKLLAGKEIK